MQNNNNNTKRINANRQKQIVLKQDPRTGLFNIKLDDFKKLMPILPQSVKQDGSIYIVTTQNGSNPLQVGITETPPPMQGFQDLARLSRARFLLSSLETTVRRKDVRVKVLDLLSKMEAIVTTDLVTSETIPNLTRMLTWVERLNHNLDTLTAYPRTSDIDKQCYAFILASYNSIIEKLAEDLPAFVSSPVAITKVPLPDDCLSSIVSKLTSSKIQPSNGALISTFLFPKRGKGSLNLTIEEWMSDATRQSLGSLMNGSVGLAKIIITLANTVVPENLRGSEQILKLRIPLVPPTSLLFLTTESRIGVKAYNPKYEYAPLFQLAYNYACGFRSTASKERQLLCHIFQRDDIIDPTSPVGPRLQTLRVMKKDLFNSAIQIPGSSVVFRRLLNMLQDNLPAVLESEYGLPDPDTFRALITEGLARPTPLVVGVKEVSIFDEPVDLERKDVLREDSKVKIYLLRAKQKRIAPSSGSVSTREVGNFLKEISDSHHELYSLRDILIEYLLGFHNKTLLTLAFNVIQNAALKYSLKNNSDIEFEDDPLSEDSDESYETYDL